MAPACIVGIEAQFVLLAKAACLRQRFGVLDQVELRRRSPSGRNRVTWNLGVKDMRLEARMDSLAAASDSWTADEHSSPQIRLHFFRVLHVRLSSFLTHLHLSCSAIIATLLSFVFCCHSVVSVAGEYAPLDDECARHVGFFSGHSGVRWPLLNVSAIYTVCDQQDFQQDDRYRVYRARILLNQGNHDTALKLIRESVADDPKAMRFYAVLLENGVVQNPSLSPEEIYKKATEQGDADAAIRFGWITESRGTPQDKQSALRTYHTSVNKRFYLGFAAIGLAHERGIGVKANLDEAADWYYQAALAGDVWSLIRLGSLKHAEKLHISMADWQPKVREFVSNYRPHDNTVASILRECGEYKVNLSRTAERIRSNSRLKALDQAALLQNVAQLANGTSSLDTALLAFERVSRSNPNALAHFYELYLLSDLPTKALELVKNVVRNHPSLKESFRTNTETYRLFETITREHACKILSSSGDRDVLRIRFDEGAVFLWPLLACLEGASPQESELIFQDGRSKYRKLGVEYEDSIALNFAALSTLRSATTDPIHNPSIALAYSHLIAAALQGNVQAQRNIGVYETMSHNLERSKFEAFRWFYVSHEQGHAPASYSLASFFEDRDPVERIRLLRVAAEHGYPQAYAALGKMLLELPKTKDEGIYWLTRGFDTAETESDRIQIMGVLKKYADAERKDNIETSSRYFERHHDVLRTRIASASVSPGDLPNFIRSVEQTAADAATLKRDREAVEYRILAAELKALYFDSELNHALPYFKVIGRSCVYGNLSKTLRAQGAPQAALHYAIRSVNLLQEARQYIGELPVELRECFLKVHEDRYRWLADLFVQMERLGEAEQVLAMLDDFKSSEFVRGDDEQDGASARIDNGPIGQALEEATTGLVGRTLRIAATRAELADRRAADPASVDTREWQAINASYESAFRAFKVEISSISAILGKQNAQLPNDLVAFPLASDPRLALSRSLQAHLSSPKSDGSVAALLTFVLPGRTTVLVVTSSGRAFHRWEIESSNLNSTVAEFREAIRLGKPEAKAIGHRLYENLLAPVMPELRRQGVRTLLVSLDRALSYIPLAALYDGEHYLVEKVAIALLTPDAGLVGPQQTPASWTAAAFGVSEPVEGFDPLPAVREELESVVRRAGEQLGALPGDRWINKEFTTDAINLALTRAPNVVHFATHFVTGHSESASYLVIGGGNRISLKDMGESLNFEQVTMLVLSACNTGVPVHTDHDARIESAARRLQQIGRVQTVVGTLWPVVDGSTADFMQLFYRELTSRNTRSSIDALAAAQRAFIAGDKPASTHHNVADRQHALEPLRDHRLPKYWASFVMVGGMP